MNKTRGVMDAADVIAYLAASEARRVRPVRAEELRELREAGAALPVLTLGRDPGSGRWAASGSGAEGHDNAPRLPHLCAWLNARVLPLLEAERGAPGWPALTPGHYRVELHDSYGYLPGARQLEAASGSRQLEAAARLPRHDNCFAFCRPRAELWGGPAARADCRVALLPDPFQMDDYGGLVAAAAADPVPWERKRPALFFAGSTTGERDARSNLRVRACVGARELQLAGLWPAADAQAAGVPPSGAPGGAAFGGPPAVMRITQVVQMAPAAALEREPRLRGVLGPYAPLEEHFGYRYQVNLRGNTACWSRVPMVLASRSLLLDVRHQDACWYAPALREGTHYVGVAPGARTRDTLDALEEARRRCEAEGAALCGWRVREANRFAAGFLTSAAAAAYAAQLLTFSG